MPIHYPAGEQPKTWVAGTVIFTHSKGTVGALIRFGQKVRLCGWRAWRWKNHPDYKYCYYNHVAVVVNSQGGIVEALADGVVMPSAGMTKYLGAEYTVWEPNPLYDIRRGIAWVTYEYRRHVAYGWASIASIVLQILTGTRFSISYKDSKVCSAVGAMHIEHSGGCLPYDDSRNVMPAELAKFLGVEA